jgi:excisionase family DNA binding protein
VNDQLLYSRKDAAGLLSISVRTLNSLVAGGRIKAKRIGRRTLISRHELDRFVKSADVDVVDPGREKATGKEARQ